MYLGESIRFDYTGDMQSIILLPGVYRIELYGASGGIGSGNGNPFGKGGFISGELTINSSLNAPPPLLRIYIFVGQQGIDNWQTTTRFNGGGKAINYGGHNGGAGGGATDIRLISGPWDNIESLKSRILVAGGGGGAQSTCGWSATAGDGGNLTGGTSYNLNYGGVYWEHAMKRAYSTGGTQIKAGYGYNVNDGNYTSIASGGFGYGASSVVCGAGGGSGYYGGGSGYTSGGGGGSSFAAGYPGCDTTYSEYHNGIIFDNVVFEQGVNTGNGYAIIIMIRAGTERRNSNFYRDANLQECFDFSKLQATL